MGDLANAAALLRVSPIFQQAGGFHHTTLAGVFVITSCQIKSYYGFGGSHAAIPRLR